MKISDNKIRSIAAAAEPIHQRIQNNHYSSDITDEALSIKKDLERSYRDNKTITLQECLNIFLPENREITEYLSFNRLSDSEPLPQWAIAIQEHIAEFKHRYTPADQLHDEFSKIPFSSLLYPIADLLIDDERIRCLSSSKSVDNDIPRQVKLSFTKRISRFISQAFHLEFRLFKKRASSINNDKNSYIKEFRQEQSKGGLIKTLGHYPMAARYIGLAIIHWSEFLDELLTRIIDDMDEIRDIFDISNSSSLTHVEIGKGDFHNEERSVTRLEFNGGSTVYYKPRDSRAEQIYNQFCNYISEQPMFSTGLNQIKTLQRDGYGYVEGISNQPLSIGDGESKAGIQNYYNRIGYLLFIGYITNTTDLHYENILTDGSHPYMIDCETIFSRNLMHNYIRPEYNHNKVLATKLSESVLNTDLLPFKTSTDVDDAGNQSGISQIQSFETANKLVRWNHVNSDEMEYTVGYENINPTSSKPQIDGETALPSDYIEEIISGFETAYNHFQSLENPNKSVFGDINLSAAKTRYLLRDTSVYAGLIQSMVSPNQLRSAGKTFLVTNRLITGLDKLESKALSIHSQLFKAEQEGINQLNIPKYGVENQDLLYKNVAIEHNAFEKLNSEIFQHNVSMLSDTDRKKQIGIIKSVLS